jgi:hypothetical protein
LGIGSIGGSFSGGELGTNKSYSVVNSNRYGSVGISFESIDRKVDVSSNIKKEITQKPYSYADDPAIKEIVAKLQTVDMKVKIHEASHIAGAAGVSTSGANFTYQTGPDGRQYAVAGEVGIDIAEDNDPKKNIQKMQAIKSAAMAPSDPSPQDIKVASMASVLEMKSRIQESKENQQDGKLNDAIKAYTQNREDIGSFSISA